MAHCGQARVMPVVIPKNKLPKWLTSSLLTRMIGEVDQHPSYAKYVDNAARFYGAYRGPLGLGAIEGIDDTSINDRQATARRNFIAEATDELESILMSNYPVVKRWPLRAEDAGLSDAQDDMFLAAWEDSNGQFVASSILRNAEITGLGVGKVVWNPENKTKDKSGEIMFECLPYSAVKIDPHASNTQRGRDVRYIIHTVHQPVEDIVRKYGKPAEDALNLPKPGSKKKGGATFSHMTEQEQASTMDVLGDSRDVHECWIFPRTQGMSQMVGEEVEKVSEFPFGLVATMVENTIVRVITNPFVSRKGRIVSDEYGYPKKEYIDIGSKRHPFVFMWWKRISGAGGYNGMYDCMGMIEQMIPLQVNVNALRRNIAINARTTANPQMAVNQELIDDPVDTLTQEPGGIIRVARTQRASDAIHMIQPPAMPSYAFQLLMSEQSQIKETTGLKPGVMGLPAEGGGTSHTPFATIGSLQLAAFAPLKKYVKELDAMLLDASVNYDGLMQQKYKPGRYMVTTRYGREREVEWSDRNITSNFRRHVVLGATTAMYDMDKQVRINEIAMLAKEALITKDPEIINVTIVQIQNLDDPWKYDILELLQDAYDKLTLQLQQMQQLGMEGMAAGAAGGGQGDTDAGIQELAAQMGQDPAELAAALEQ